MGARRRRIAVLGFAGALPVVLAAWVAYSEVAFGTWNPMDEPARISYCGSTFVAAPDGTHLTRAQIEADGHGLGIVPLQQVGFTASGTGIYAQPLPDSVRSQFPGGASWPCATYVYLKVGADDYRWYLQTAVAL